jgi:hypothetical protein
MAIQGLRDISAPDPWIFLLKLAVTCRDRTLSNQIIHTFINPAIGCKRPLQFNPEHLKQAAACQ